MKKILLIMLMSIIFFSNLICVYSDSNNPPVLPDNIYGTIRINEHPADINTQIIAKINNVIVGDYTINQTGQFGNNTSIENRFLIAGYFLDIGEPTEFYLIKEDQEILGVTIPEIIIFESGETKKVILNFNFEEMIVPPESPPIIDDENETNDIIIDHPISGGGNGGSGGGSSSNNNPAPQITKDLNDISNLYINNSSNLDINNTDDGKINLDSNLPHTNWWPKFLKFPKFGEDKNLENQGNTNTDFNLKTTYLKYLLLIIILITLIILVIIYIKYKRR
ncbi:MAG: hypothetical protein WCX82_00140 [archaeon]|jgi:hypothetical protein